MKWKQEGKGDAQYAKYAQHYAEYARDYAPICTNKHVMHTHKAQAGCENQNASDCRAVICGNSGPLKVALLTLKLCKKVHNAG